MASSGAKKQTREEYKKAQELEAARKAGTAAPEIDFEGNMINPHIPQYISDAPWYLNKEGPGLQHQKDVIKIKKPDDMNQWYKRGQKQGDVPLRFKKGACENCGAMSHKKRDCTERPRKKGAKHTGEDLKRDDVLVNMDHLNFDSKRDRWNGYDSSDYQRVLDEHEKIENERLKLKESQIENELLENETEEIEDDKGYTENAPQAGQKFDAKKRITVRNLRIREQTAKFLLNYDTNSAFYDPKTRSMRGNPYENKAGGDVNYVSENFMRTTGDAINVMKSQVFSWNKEGQGEELSLSSNPTMTERAMKKDEEEKNYEMNKHQVSIVEKYGGTEHLDAPPMELLLGQTEHYVEYDRTGKVVKGEEKAIPKSRYPEDVLFNNHREIWGSYWEDGDWGYACCHSLIHGSYCVGEIGIRAKKSQLQDKALMDKEEPIETKTLLEEHQENMKTKKKSKKSKKDKLQEESAEEKRKREVKEAMIKLDREEREGELELNTDERKRGYNSRKHNSMDSLSNKPTEAELEAYRLKKGRFDDPMANFK